MLRRAAALVGVVVAGVAAAGCVDDEPATTASGNACSSAVDDADIAEPREPELGSSAPAAIHNPAGQALRQ